LDVCRERRDTEILFCQKLMTWPCVGKCQEIFAHGTMSVFWLLV
jgi:hypothetical protein